MTMPAPKAKLGTQWMSPTDVRCTITKIQSSRTAHSTLLSNLSAKIDRHGEQVSASLRGLDPRDRPSVVAKSVRGFRSELARESADQRLAHTRELAELADRVRSGATHYKSPVQMLMRDTLGSERRSRIMQQIANSGPVEIASLAEFAAARKDNELAAALCSRIADLPRAERPFSAAALADVLFGDLHRELSQAMVESERRVLEGLNEDTEFETGARNPQRSLEVAMLRKREQEIGAYAVEDEADDADAPDDEDQEPVDRIAAGLEARRSKGTAAG
jgi:hypothetical protein